MKKIRAILVGCGLVAVTTTVVAGRPAFVNSNVYADIAGTKVLIANSSSMPGFNTSGTNQAKVVSSVNGTTQYNLFTHNGTTYIPLYTSGY